MKNRCLRKSAKAAPFLFAVGLLGVDVVRAQTFTLLHSFSDTDGSAPEGRLVQGRDGNFYGTTSDIVGAGSSTNSGTVFRIDSDGHLTTLHTFNGEDGYQPSGALVQDSDGYLYGTTAAGVDSCYGTVFKVDMAGTVTTLHCFNGVDGARPRAGLVQGTDGDFYGTTLFGGSADGCGRDGCGTVFKIDPAGRFTTLHSFNGADGAYPRSELVLGKRGNLYGTTTALNDMCCGTIFRVDGTGHLITLRFFARSDQADAQFPGRLIEGRDGNVYGTTAGLSGIIFRINSRGTLTTLFTLDSYPFGDPLANLIQASDGAFYGTGINIYSGIETIVKVDSTGKLKTLYSLSGSDVDGRFVTGLSQGSDGNLYGTAQEGGSSDNCFSYGFYGKIISGCGTVFSISRLDCFDNTGPSSKPCANVTPVTPPQIGPISGRGH